MIIWNVQKIRSCRYACKTWRLFDAPVVSGLHFWWRERAGVPHFATTVINHVNFNPDFRLHSVHPLILSIGFNWCVLFSLTSHYWRPKKIQAILGRLSYHLSLLQDLTINHPVFVSTIIIVRYYCPHHLSLTSIEHKQSSIKPSQTMLVINI